LKRRLIETWLGIQQHIIDHAIDQWRVGLNECVKAKGKHFTCYDVLFHKIMSIICFENGITVFFVSQLLTSHDFYNFSSGC